MRLISNELKSIVDAPNLTGTSVNVNVYGGYNGVNPALKSNIGQINNITKKEILTTYFKRRAFSIIYTVIVLILLVTTSLFTDMGLNIGQVIYNAVSNFLGF